MFLGRVLGIRYFVEGHVVVLIQFKERVFDEVVEKFIQEVYRFEENHPEYGLRQYGEILRQNGLSWDMDSMEKAETLQLEGKCIMALILVDIRADRFCDGSLKDFYI